MQYLCTSIYTHKMNNNNYKVGIFIPCCVDQFNAATGIKMMHLLQKLGIDCYYPDDLTCCGMHLYQQGNREAAKQLGERLIGLYGQCTYIVSCSSACVAFIQHEFPHLFHNTAYHNDYRNFTSRCLDISDFLVNFADYKPSGISFPHKVAILEHCTTRRDYTSPAHPERKGLHDEPRILLNAIDGLQLLEMPQADVCCGFGGLFASQFTPISDSLARRKAENALSVGAEVIVSTEPSCLLHMQSYIDKNKLPLKCRHIVDILVNDDTNT